MPKFSEATILNATSKGATICRPTKKIFKILFRLTHHWLPATTAKTALETERTPVWNAAVMSATSF